MSSQTKTSNVPKHMPT